MELFKRNPFVRGQKVAVTEPVFTPVEAVDSEETPKNYLMLAALSVAALAFAVLVAVSATWLYHKAHKPAPAANSSNNLPQPPPQDLTPSSHP